MPKSFATEGLQKPAAPTTPLVHLQVPPGMDAALRGLTREVLRRQPSDLYLFAHRYFESLLAARVAQQASEEAADAETLYSSKKQSKHSESSYTHSSSMREFFQDDEPRTKGGSREIVHRIHLEDESSPKKNVVHNINIELEDEDTSIGETTVKVEITDDGRKRSERKRTESRDTTSFEEEITRTRTEHVTVCKSWKVETRVETSESGEIRVVESFTDDGKPHGKTKQSSKKPRKFASEEEKKSQSLIEEEKRTAKSEREKKKKESSTKSKSFENVDTTASRELILLERQAAAQKLKSDEGKKYQSFIRLDDEESAKGQSERLIEIEREGEREEHKVLTRSRREAEDSTREASPDGPLLTQSPQAALQQMEESLIQLKELEKKDSETREQSDSAEKKDSLELERQKQELRRDHISPEDALNEMEKSLIQLKESSLIKETETRTEEVEKTVSEATGEVSLEPEKSESLDEKQSISIKSEEESKTSLISEEKHKIIENVKEVVHEIEEKASSVLGHIHGSQMLEEKQSMSMKSEEESKSYISGEKHKIIETVKDVVQEIEDKTSSVLSHFPGKGPSSPEKTEHPERAESTDERIDSFDQKIESFTEKNEILDPNSDGKESIVVEAQIGDEKSEVEAEKRSPEPEERTEEGKKAEDLKQEETDGDGASKGRRKREVELLVETEEDAVEQDDVKGQGSGVGESKKESSEEKLEPSSKATDDVTASQEEDQTFQQLEKDTKINDAEGEYAPAESLKGKVDDSKTTEESMGKGEPEENDKISLEREKSEQDATESLEKEKSEQDATESLGKEKSERDATESLEKEKPEQDATESLEKEKSEQDATESLEKEKSEQDATESLEKEKSEQDATKPLKKEKSDQASKTLLERDGEKSLDESSEKEEITEKSGDESTEADVESAEKKLEGDQVQARMGGESIVDRTESSDRKDSASDTQRLKENFQQVEKKVEDQVETDNQPHSETKPSKPAEEEAPKEKPLKPPEEKVEAPEEGVSREITVQKEEAPAPTEPAKEPGSSKGPIEQDAVQEKNLSEQEEATDETTLGESTSDKENPQAIQEIHRVRRSAEETHTKTEELSESTSTTVMTRIISLEGPEREIKIRETELKADEGERSETLSEEVNKEQVDIEDVFGHKTYLIEDSDALFETPQKHEVQEDTTVRKDEVQRQDSTETVGVPLPTESSSEEEVKQASVEKSKDDEESLNRESSEEKPGQRKQTSLDEESSSVSEGTGDRFLPPTVVISRVADVVELTDGEAKIVSQMEKEGLTTEYDENTKVKAGYWSSDDANKFLTGESQHTYNTLKKPELFYSDLLEGRPPEKPVSEEPEKDAKEIETPMAEYVVEEQEESSPQKTSSLSQDSDSKGPIKFSLVEVNDDGEEIKDKPWLTRAQTVDEMFYKETAGDVMPISPTPPRRKSVSGQVDVMMEMSKATSRIGQSIMVLSGGEKRPVKRADSDEYCISEDAIYIPLRPEGAEPDIVEALDDEPFRLDQPPPTFTYDSDEGEWGAALAEHLKNSEPSLTTVIIERKVDDPTALGRVTITEITEEEEKAMTQEHAAESKETELAELPKPVFDIGSPVSDRSKDPSDHRGDAKHRPSLADISEENLESVDDTEASMNVELHISLSDGDNLSQRSYGTDSERKWTEDLSNVAHKAKDAATGVIKNLFSPSPRRDQQSPSESESSVVLEGDDGKKRTSKHSVSKDESKEPDGPKGPLTIPITVGDETKDMDELAQESKDIAEGIQADRTEVKIKEDTQDYAKTGTETEEALKTGQKESDKKEQGLAEERKEEPSQKDEDKPMPRSLQESNETTQESLTSVSLPLPDASYDIQNMTLSTTDIDIAGVTDVKDLDVLGKTDKSTKPKEEETESRRSKRSAESEEDVVKDQPKSKKNEEKIAPGSGAAAGSAVHKVAEAEDDQQETEDPRASAKDPKETGLAGQEPVSEPKDSMTSVISETLDSVESLPSEVSKALWSIEDVPLAENLNESGVQEEERPRDEGMPTDDPPEKAKKLGTLGDSGSRRDSREKEDEDKERSLKRESEVADEVLENIEKEVGEVEEKADSVKKEGANLLDRAKSEEGKVESLTHRTKDELYHELERGVEAVQDSWEEINTEEQKIQAEMKEELKGKLNEVTDVVKTVKEVEGAAAENVHDDIEKHVQNTKEEVQEAVKKLGEDIEEKVEESERKMEKTVEEEERALGRVIDNAGNTVIDVKQKIISVFEKERDEVEDVEDKAPQKLEEVSVEIKEKVKEAKGKAEEKNEEEKTGFSKFIGGVADAIEDVKEKLSETVTHVREEAKSGVSDSEKRVEECFIEIKETVEEKTEHTESAIKEEFEKKERIIKEESSKLEDEVIQIADVVEPTVEKGKDKVKELSESARDELIQVKDEITEKVGEVKDRIGEVIREVEDKTEEIGKEVKDVTENVQRDAEKVAEEKEEDKVSSLGDTEMDEVERRLEESIEREENKGVDTVDSTKKTKSNKEQSQEVEKESREKAEKVEKSEKEEAAVSHCTAKVVLDKRKSEEDKLEVGITEISARSLALPEALEREKNEWNVKTNSSEQDDSSEARRTKRHILKRADTLEEVPQSTDTIPSESVDETSATSLERADTVVHVTLDEPDTQSESIRKDEVVVPIHVELQEASPVPPGKDTKATETDLLEKETVSRGTEPEETTEQIAEALRSEVKDLEERLSRLKESTWSLSHAGADPRKGQGDVHTSKGHDWNPDDITEKTIHVKKSISSAESMSFASRVLSTPMGSVREEYSEMKKSTAETTHETIFTVDKGVQSEEGETSKDGAGDSGPERRTTVTTATQVSVPSDEPSDKASRRALFQRAKSMDANTEARAITNFSQRKTTYESQKKVPSRTEAEQDANPRPSIQPGRSPEKLQQKCVDFNATATKIQAAYRRYHVGQELRGSGQMVPVFYKCALKTRNKINL